ncbi:hypothetical protein Q9L58_004978 [Maublancomyces gigas]|uniref:F-box domain-containing protein n=1 Tax=Discina gigas TaxID=1032678 RepID=A0ABR3GJZ1_9PEZI
MGFIDPGKNNNSRIAGLRPHYRRPCPPMKGPRCSKRPLKQHPRPDSDSSTPRRTTPKTTTPPPPKPLSRFESLPVEILHNIFTHSHNAHLAATSPHLSRILAARNLQLTYVHERSRCASALTHTFTFRFFTASFLAHWERRFARELDCTDTCVPVRAMCAPWTQEKLRLFAALVERGARLAADERDVQLGVLHEALVAGRRDVVGLLVVGAGLKPDVQSLRLAMRHTVGEEGELDVCVMLAGQGVGVTDLGVWREALALGRGPGGARAVRWLLAGGTPPGEVLGELSKNESWGVE